MRCSARARGCPAASGPTRSARWVPDVGARPGMPRSAPAAREGVRAALAFPIESRGEVLGVIEFFSAEAREPDDELVDLLSGIGSQVGQFVLRREAERDVRASEARKSAIVNAALDCIVSLDAGGRITEFNPAAEATFGRSRDDAIGMPVTDLLIPERLRGEHAAAFERYLKGGEPHSPGQAFRVVPACAPTGRSSHWSWPITRVDLPGPPVFTGYLRDLTDSRLAERIARDLAAIVESTEDAILSKTLDGVILTWNRGAELLTATPPTRRSASRCRCCRPETAPTRCPRSCGGWPPASASAARDRAPP